MPTVLTDNDSFDTAAAVPLDGDAATAASVNAEFQVLQNRTLYCKNRASEAKSEADGIASSLSGKYAIVQTIQAGASSSAIDGTTPSATLADVSGSSNTFSSVCQVGDIVRFTLGPFKVASSDAAGNGKVSLVIIENALGLGSVTHVDYVIAPGVAWASAVPFNITFQHTIGTAGTLAFKLQTASDGTHSFYFVSYVDKWGFAEILRAFA